MLFLVLKPKYTIEQRCMLIMMSTCINTNLTIIINLCVPCLHHQGKLVIVDLVLNIQETLNSR